MRRRLPAWFVGEFFGTFILVFFGCGSVATAVLTGAQVGIFQVAIVWGIGIATAIYLTGGLSGAHLNPAVTIALATWSGFPWKGVPRYLAAQFLGAMAASALLFAIYHGTLASYEAANHITRGATGSEASAMIFGEYFPNPGGKPLTDAARLTVSASTAFLAEASGTAILLLVILGATHPRNAARPQILTAATIGLTITLLISLLGPLTMAAFNPARDLGPRLFSSLVGWGTVPFTVNGLGWLTVYIVAPIVGGQIGGLIYRLFFQPHFEAAGDQG
ncbi:MAG TPA: MIP family channel protein [Candidatus Didemnitutus sp.]|nr:MIP family channel protein [Candidatus Didemnitutus sp.]